jgi:hypothetical protein
MVAASEQGGEVFGGLGRVMMHSDRSDEWRRVMAAVFDHLKADLSTYGPEEQQRIEPLLRTMGVVTQ